ncbi:hypothetical protein ACHAWF_001581 [Thalassiosira exigua]
MDESFSAAAGPKFPEGEPRGDWTVEELVRWSLDRYQSKVREDTARNVASLREQCEKECEDVLTLHEAAVEMEKKNGGGAGEEEAEGGGDEENADPQRRRPSQNNAAEGGAAKPSKSESASSAGGDGGAAKPSSSSLEIQITAGPHAPSKFFLLPRPGAPCLVGRSKGKKFVKNGVSLHKDKEISTTHGKFLVEGGMGGSGGLGGGGGDKPKFYFVDVGSTNGTVYEGEPLEPNKRLPLADGTELTVGNSELRVVLG